MSASNDKAIATLNKLIKLSQNSEEGFRVVAENVDNRGLKMLLKAYAQQRAQFGDELQAEVNRLDGQIKTRTSILGMIHRGWITIKSGMTLGNHRIEQVVLHEAYRGEQYAVKQYEKALHVDLPEATQTLVERQCETVQSVSHDIYDMVKNPENRLVVRLFDNDADVNQAEAALHQMGLDDEIRVMGFNTAVSQYNNKHIKRNTILETITAGSLGGAILGIILGFIFGIGIWLIPDIDMTLILASSLAGTVAVLVLVGGFIGAMFAGFIATLIGFSASEQDEFLYEDSVNHGQTLMLVFTDRAHANEASDIMHQVNLARFM